MHRKNIPASSGRGNAVSPAKSTEVPLQPTPAPKPAIRIEASSDGCDLTFYAPAGYIIEAGITDLIGSSVPIDETGVMKHTHAYGTASGAIDVVGKVGYGNIRATTDGPVLAAVTAVVKTVCTG